MFEGFLTTVILPCSDDALLRRVKSRQTSEHFGILYILKYVIRIVLKGNRKVVLNSGAENPTLVYSSWSVDWKGEILLMRPKEGC